MSNGDDGAQGRKAEQFNQIVRGAVTLLFAVTMCALTLLDVVKGGQSGLTNIFTNALTMVLTFWFVAAPDRRRASDTPTPGGPPPAGPEGRTTP